MSVTSRHQRGISLIEVLVGLAIGLIVAFAIITLFSSTTTSSQLIIEKGKLDRDLHHIMDSIVTDIHRAGYSATAATTSNAFMASGVDITVSDATGADLGTSPGTCVTFAYDNNADGALQADDEEFGFRLQNNIIQFRAPGNTFSCAAPATNWTNLTDSNVIVITAFTVTKSNVAIDTDGSGPNTHTINYRTLTIAITGHLTSTPTITKTITRTIKLYNNKYLP